MRSALLTTAAVLLGATPVLAHGGGGNWQALQSQIPALFAQADADGNGSLSPAEFKTFRELVAQKRAELWFQKLDTNGDGALSLDELTAHAAKRHARRHAG